jgi:hypothetical protein
MALPVNARGTQVAHPAGLFEIRTRPRELTLAFPPASRSARDSDVQASLQRGSRAPVRPSATLLVQ